MSDQPVKGLRVDILRSSLPDCSNGGISGRCQYVTLIDVPGPSEPGEDAPACRLVRRNIGGKVVVSAVPVETPGGVGPMMGGCYIATSDSRFREAVGFYGAVALHDRWETPAQCAALSK